MFNKVNPRLQPRVEKWIMEITDFDFELKYEPGRSELDPLDYISRHSISENYRDNTEQVITHISHKENAETFDRIRTETERQYTKKIDITRYQQWLNQNWKGPRDITIQT